MAYPISTIGIYDLALKGILFNKYGHYLGLSSSDTSIVFTPEEVAQREFAEKRGEATSNFISFWRTDTQFSWDRQRTTAGRKGVTIDFTDNTKTFAASAKAIPVDLTYDMCHWALSLDTIQRMTEEYMFWIHENPTIALTINGYPFQTNIHLKNQSEASTIGNMYKQGKYFMLKYKMVLDSWIFKFEDVKTIEHIVFTVNTGSKDNHQEVYRKEFP